MNVQARLNLEGPELGDSLIKSGYKVYEPLAMCGDVFTVLCNTQGQGVN